MSWYSFRPYVSAAQRRRKAEAAAKKLSKKGRPLAPVQLDRGKIAATFWGKAWCDNLESYSDYANRLPRGRTYVRNGSVLDLQIANGKIEALVQGSDLYKITVAISPFEAKRWRKFKQNCAGKITNLLDLVQGRLSKEILTDITMHGTGLFPSPKEIQLRCSCPDWADMCKHVAAVLYGIGVRLDTAPELFFTLRGVDMQELVTEAGATAIAPIHGAPTADSALDGADLSEIFGVEIDLAPEAGKVVPASAPAQPASRKGKKPQHKNPASPSRKGTRKSPAAPVTARSKKRVSRRAGR
jgi:uncharacterized Zn finger protein